MPHIGTGIAIIPSATLSILLFIVFCSQVTPIGGRIFERCELARELHRRRVPPKELATWVCIAQYESSLNTAAIGHLNGDGSGDHGIFQINDRVWCSPSGTGCGVSCASVRTPDIGRALQCARKIFEQTRRREHNGFLAWTTYERHCRPAKSVKSCLMSLK